MTQEEFIKVLNMKGYSYKIEGDKLVVTHEDDVFLRALASLPPGVEFRNKGNVDLESLTSLTPLTPGVVFNNRGDVYLDSITSIPPGVVFKKVYDVKLDSLIGGYFHEWEGNTKLSKKRLLNLMISKGIFER